MKIKGETCLICGIINGIGTRQKVPGQETIKND
jgi:hypothetical protein